MFRHVFVPTDGSELSERAAAAAVAFARDAGARITAFFARPEFPATYYGDGAIKDPETPERFAEIAEQQAAGCLGAIEAMCRAAGVPCQAVSAASDAPHEAIVAAAARAGCDLVFMASHGRRGLSALLLGSVTNKVLAASTIPVLVWR